MIKSILSLLLAISVVAGTFAQVTSTDGTFSTGSASTDLSLITGTTTRLTILSSNGNIGINTISPSDRLHVNGTLRAANINSTTGLFNVSSGSNPLSFATNSTTRLTVLQNGNVGIGTASPTELLDVNGAARIRSITQDNALTQILAADATGKVFWRTASSLAVSFPHVYSTDILGIGQNSLASNTTGVMNTAYGNNSLYSNTFGRNNTAIGHEASYFNQYGESNVAIGYQALYSSVSSANNVAIGTQAMYSEGSGTSQVAIGYGALYSSGGSLNTAVGAAAMSSNTEGSQNTAVGVAALRSNTTGDWNAAFGMSALPFNTTGTQNTALGIQSMYNNSTGLNNAAMGANAMWYNTSGIYNTAVGHSALAFNETGSYNSAVGHFAGPASGSTNLNNTAALGYGATTTASDQVRIGNSAVTSIGGQVSWSTLSDGRFKKDVKEDVSGLEFITQLRPVSYTVDRDAVDTFLGIPDSLRSKRPEARKISERQTGFVAQEVEKVIQKTGYVFYGVDAPKNAKDHYSIRYAEFVVPLVKAVQELSTKVEEQQHEIDLLLARLGENESIKNENSSDAEAKLFQNNPNPFSGDTEIAMSLPESAIRANIIVYNLEGKQLKNIQVRDRGQAVVKISAHELNAGMYIYALIVDNKVIDTKRMILTR